MSLAFVVVSVSRKTVLNQIEDVREGAFDVILCSTNDYDDNDDYELMI